MKQSWLGKLRNTLFRVGARPSRFFIRQALRDEQTRAWLLHTLGNDIAMTKTGLSDFMPDNLVNISGFEDCDWLFSSNPLNHGPSRLRIDEAAFLFRLVRKLPYPRVAELGRYKGGTTFLLAAAGASVLSLDNGGIPGQADLSESLRTALGRFGLQEKCTIRTVDALDYDIRPNSYDLVFLDIGLDDSEITRQLFERWWYAVKPGRFFLFRDGKDTVLSQAACVTAELQTSEIGGTINFILPGSFVLCTKYTRSGNTP